MQVQIWSDVACPWCAVGKRRFEAALAGFAQAGEITVRYRSFELDPAAPAVVEGDYAGKLAAKYGTSPAEAQTMMDRMTATAAEDGWRFRFDHIRPGNTFDAHRLLHLAADLGRQLEVKERFLAGYLEDGVAIGDPTELRALAVAAGLPGDEVDGVLSSDRYAAAVRADEEQAAAYGIRGVPFFVLDGRYGVSGAQPPGALLQALEQAWADRATTPATRAPSGDDHDHPAGEACADGSCAVG